MTRIISLVTWGSRGGPFPRIVRWLARGLEAKGYRADVVFIQEPKGVQEVSPNIREIGLGTRARYAAVPLYRYFKETKPAFVLATPLPSALAALMAGRLAGVPVVPWEATFLDRSIPLVPLQMRLFGPWFRRLLYGWAPAVAATSREVTSGIQKEFDNKGAFVLPNPCDLYDIRSLANASKPKNFASDNYSLIAVGRLSPEKGIDVILKALGILRDRGINQYELRVLGEGPYRSDYEQLAAKLGLQDRVEFLGYVPNPYSIMAEADIFVHAARWEGFGMVVVEAMALGLPVVATTCPGGPKEILDFGKYGILVPPDNPEELAQAIASLIQNPQKRQRLSELSLERVEQYRPERIAERLLEIAEYVWNQRRAG